MSRNVCALTVADLHDPDESNIGDDSSVCTDDDSYLGNSSLRNMVTSSLQLLESLTSEVAELSKEDSHPTVVTPTYQDDPRDMTIDVSFRSKNYNKSTTGDNASNRTRMTQPTSNTYDVNRIVDDDDVSLDDSVSTEMKALKEVASELEKALKSQDIRIVQKAIERIGNSTDPKLKNVLESDDKEIIRRILDDELKKGEPSSIVKRYLYKCVTGTLSEGDTCRFLVTVIVLMWSVVFVAVQFSYRRWT
jgi:hypothetical protein